MFTQMGSQKLKFLMMHSYIPYELASSFTKLSMNLHLQKSRIVLFFWFHQVLHMQEILDAIHFKLKLLFKRTPLTT